MTWFCKKYQVCAQCRVHFEPYRISLSRPELCPEHREPAIKLELRKELVMRWAARNWEILEPQAKEDEAKARSVLGGIGSIQMQQMMAQAQSNAAGSPLGGALGGIIRQE